MRTTSNLIHRILEKIIPNENLNILGYNIVAEIDRLDFPVGLIGINQSSYAVKFLTRIEARGARGVWSQSLMMSVFFVRVPKTCITTENIFFPFTVLKGCPAKAKQHVGIKYLHFWRLWIYQMNWTKGRYICKVVKSQLTILQI